jgi:FtsZ-interacting cell division protein ZipA
MGNHSNKVVRWDIIGWCAGILTIAIIGAIFIGVPKYHYAHASAFNKCQIDLKKLRDDDKFCNTDNEIKSHKDIEAAQAASQAKAKEVARRAALTPQQRCEEDHKTTADPDSGEVFIPICHVDGTYTYESASDLEEQMHQDEQDTQDSSCNPNYSGACVPIASDVDCAGGSGNGPAYVYGPVYVIGTDIYGLDRDGDGVGCE